MGIIVGERPFNNDGPRVDCYFRTERSDFVLVRYRYESILPMRTRSYLLREISDKSKEKMIYVKGNFEIIYNFEGQKVTGKVRKLLKNINDSLDVKKITNKDWFKIDHYLKNRKSDYFEIKNILEKYL